MNNYINDQTARTIHYANDAYLDNARSGSSKSLSAFTLTVDKINWQMILPVQIRNASYQSVQLDCLIAEYQLSISPSNWTVQPCCFNQSQVMVIFTDNNQAVQWLKSI